MRRTAGSARYLPKRRVVIRALGALPLVSSAFAATVDPAIVGSLAPTGKLRASINLGNPILASRDAATGEVVGVSVDLARALAARLGIDVELIVVDAAGKSVDAVANGRADIGFFAIDPLRGESIAFTAPYVLIEGSYLVRVGSPLRSNDDVDRVGHRVVVGRASAYDLYLSRALTRAALIRAPTSPVVTDVFLKENADVAAGVRQQLEADARRVPGLRLLPGRFMVIEQAMGLPKSHGQDAFGYLAAFVEEMKTEGFVGRALEAHRIEGAKVAPPGRGG